MRLCYVINVRFFPSPPLPSPLTVMNGFPGTNNSQTIQRPGYGLLDMYKYCLLTLKILNNLTKQCMTCKSANLKLFGSILRNYYFNSTH